MRYGNYSFIGAVLITGEALISIWIPKSARFISGWRLFESRRLLEKIRYINLSYITIVKILVDSVNRR